VQNRKAFIGTWFLFVVIASTTLATGNSVSLDTLRQSSSTVENQPEEYEILKQFWLNTKPTKPAVLKPERRIYSTKLIAKAQPDECFYGIGENNIYPFDFDSQRCWGGKPKVNESYVFGMTKSGKNLWFGTAPNMGCLVYATIAEQGIPGGLVAMGTNLWACEYGESQYGKARDLPSASGDWRPPSIYIYNARNDTLKEKILNDPLIFETLGLRAAGSLANVVFLAGPSISGIGGPAETEGINIFAFHARSGDFLGSRHFPEYKNIRKWVVANGVLYAGVANSKNAFAEPSEVPAGAIIRWQGNAKNPFVFEVVGWVDGDAAELAVHNGRIFVSTWPDFSKLFEESYDYAGIWMSPLIGADGLHHGDAQSWVKVWSASDYEQDEVAARMYNGGALASYQGYLYWGTTHAPMSAGLAHAQIYGHWDPDTGDIDLLKLMSALLGTHRPISIFRGRKFGVPKQEMQVLYGLKTMPAYVERSDGTGYEWQILPNKMGSPIYGTAGFGNLYNTYTWTMAEYRDELFVGTMDWSHMLSAVILPAILNPIIGIPIQEFPIRKSDFGADLFVFPSSAQSAEALFNYGVGNYSSYGVRTMVSGKALYLGMANSMNLMTRTWDRKPEGGWELIPLKAKYPRE
jgi:hypothetical protein